MPARFDTRRVNHSIAVSDDGACTNQAESYFSGLRRAEWGQHHRISGKYLGAYAREMAWRDYGPDHRGGVSSSDDAGRRHRQIEFFARDIGQSALTRRGSAGTGER